MRIQTTRETIGNTSAERLGFTLAISKTSLNPDFQIKTEAGANCRELGIVRQNSTPYKKSSKCKNLRRE